MAKRKIKWSSVNRKISDIKPYELNPRDITKDGIKDLTKSLDKFGLAEPIVINTDNIIIGGHARVLVLEAEEEKECNCYLPDRKLTKAEVKELNVRLNKNIAGRFDFDILANNYEIDELKEWGFTEEELGFIDQYGDEFELPEGEKNGFQQITFTLTDKQMKVVKVAIGRAKEGNDFSKTENDNNNGNAIWFICKHYE